MKARARLVAVLVSTGLLIVAAFWVKDLFAPTKIVVAVDAPVANKRIFDPSDMDAASFYFEENPNSRIQLKELFYDFDPKRSPDGFEAAMAEGIEFFVTTQPSSTMTASVHLFQTPKSLLINTSSTSPTMSAKDDHILRIIADTNHEQTIIAQYIDQLPGTRLLVLQDSDNAQYTDPAFAHFMAELGASDRWQVTHEKFRFETFNPAMFEELMAEPFDALYVLGGEFQASMGILVQLFYQYHPDAPIILTPWARSDIIYETAGPALERMVLIGHHPAKADDAAIEDYLNRFSARYGYQPMAMALMVRQALELLEQAFAAGHTTPESVKAYLLSQPRLQTSLGTIELDAFGDAKQGLHPIGSLAQELKTDD